MFELGPALQEFAYRWTRTDGTRVLALDETRESLRENSQWPAFFPSAIAIVTVQVGDEIFVEKVVGPSIVNRFPYVAMISLCHESLSDRHYTRADFIAGALASGKASLQFLEPGETLKTVMRTIAERPLNERAGALREAGLQFRQADGFAYLADSFLVYSGTAVSPRRDLEGTEIYASPAERVGSHTLLFFEIETIRLAREIALGRRRIHWRSLPVWHGHSDAAAPELPSEGRIKGYTPFYRFPASDTVAFEFDRLEDEMAVKDLVAYRFGEPLDNDRARWPCFFPSSVGMITVKGPDGQPNLMPCGSTAVVSRHPMVIAPAVSYARINDRYAPRASLDLIRRAGTFGCGVPYIGALVEEAIRYCGNVSIAHDPRKAAKTGLTWIEEPSGVVRAAEFPVFFECRLVGEIKLGTHALFLGEVVKIFLHADLEKETHLEWCPFAGVE